MLKEAVANAARHSGGSELSVTATAAGRFARLVVSDNGKGGVIREGSQGRGLATMKARAEALGGTMTILSAPGHGTTVEFKVRLAT
jgi:signal transduction histidine kinase